MWIALWATACNGPDNQLTKQYPEAATSLATLDFGQTAVAYSSTMTFDVLNTGPVDLTLGEVGTDDTLGAYEILGAPTVVEPGDRQPVQVTFHPPDYTTYVATLSIPTDDPDHPLLSVALTGEGIPIPTPDLETDMLSVDFGKVAVGDDGTQWFTLSNEGTGVLDIHSAIQSGSGAFSVVGQTSGFSLEPDQSVTIVVIYEPTVDGGDSGGITFASNDPDEPEATVHFLGNGGGKFEYPVAIVDGPSNAEPRETLTLNGRDSYDPNGYEPLTYEWRIVAVPDGSQSVLSEPTTLDQVYLPLDIAGVYQVSLQVTNTVGLKSAPAFYTIDAIPLELLHVELAWNTGAADFDLHLLTSEGELFAKPYDCNFCNQVPNWGATGDDDDPSLDLDDQSGYGPENINIDDPADDTYQVKVHYWNDHGDDAAVAVVRIYTYGVLVGEYYRVMDYDDVWDVAQVRWPDGVAIEETTDLSTAPTHGCYDP